MPDWVPHIVHQVILPRLCYQARCTVTVWKDPAQRGVWYQHGENPEHRHFVLHTDFIGHADPGGDWLTEAHEYEAHSDGEREAEIVHGR